MTLTELKYVVAVAEARHFGQAAERCHVSQPTLSVGVKKLEDELGVLIFERSKSAVRLTPVGESIVAQAQKVLEQAHGIRFAPPALAARFAHERVPSPGPTFGFHGMFNLHRALSPAALHALIDTLPDPMFVGMDARDLCRALLQDRRLDDAARVLDRRLRAGQHDRRTRQLQVKLAALRVARRLGWSA